MIKIPEARAKAADASLPTLVEAGSAFLRMRRMQANGGSNSTAEGSGALAAAGIAAIASFSSAMAVVAASSCGGGNSPVGCGGGELISSFLSGRIYNIRYICMKLLVVLEQMDRREKWRRVSTIGHATRHICLK
jgi:hypothetical protein